jgi:anhydro-N-acetylmuramic acid kinase
LHPPLLEALNALSYYQQAPPKSLGWEWVEDKLFPTLAQFEIPVADMLHTLIVHQAYQIAQAVKLLNPGPQTILVTGGGRHNQFMMGRIQAALESLSIQVAPIAEEIVDFKEAIGFAFLGLRTLLGLPTIQPGATGADMAAVTGSIHVPPQGGMNWL